MIPAIKMYKARAQVGLKEAKDICDKYMKKILTDMENRNDKDSSTSKGKKFIPNKAG